MTWGCPFSMANVTLKPLARSLAACSRIASGQPESSSPANMWMHILASALICCGVASSRKPGKPVTDRKLRIFRRHQKRAQAAIRIARDVKLVVRDFVVAKQLGQKRGKYPL